MSIAFSLKYLTSHDKILLLFCTENNKGVRIWNIMSK